METYSQWKERLLQLAKDKGVRFFDWDESEAERYASLLEESFVRYWTSKLTVEEVLLSEIAGRRCIKNEETVKAANKCGCFFCLRIFSPKEQEIEQWADGPIIGGYTALCPYCGIDSLLPETADYPVDLDLLERVHHIRFRGIDPSYNGE